MRRAMERTLQSGALGIKIMIGGRLNGGEIARREWAREGRVPLHTYCAMILILSKGLKFVPRATP